MQATYLRFGVDTKSSESGSSGDSTETSAAANVKRRALPRSLSLVAVVAAIAIIAVVALVVFNISTFSAKLANPANTASGGQTNVQPMNVPPRLQTDLALLNGVSNIYVAYTMTLNLPQLSAYMGKDSKITLYKLGNTTRTIMQLQLLGKTYVINSYRFKNLTVQCNAGTLNITPAAVCMVSNSSDIGLNPFGIAPMGYQNMTYIGKKKNPFGSCESFNNSVIINVSNYQGTPGNSSGNLTGAEEEVCIDGTYGYVYNMTSYTLSRETNGAINKTVLSSIQAFNVSIGKVTQANVTPPASFALGPYVSCSNSSVAFNFTPIMEPLPSKIIVTLVRYNQTLFGYDNVTLGTSSLPPGAKEMSSYRILIKSTQNMSSNTILVCAGKSCEIMPC